MMAAETPAGKRIVKGKIIAEEKMVKVLSSTRYEVHSETGVGRYEVTITDDKKHCTCPDHTNREITCKHIYAVLYAMAKPRTHPKKERVYFSPEQIAKNIERMGG